MLGSIVSPAKMQVVYVKFGFYFEKTFVINSNGLYYQCFNSTLFFGFDLQHYNEIKKFSLFKKLIKIL